MTENEFFSLTDWGDIRVIRWEETDYRTSDEAKLYYEAIGMVKKSNYSINEFQIVNPPPDDFFVVAYIRYSDVIGVY